MAIPLILPVALGAGWLALKQAKSKPSGQVGQIAGRVDATAAAANPGTYTDSDGEQVTSDGITLSDAAQGGSTSTTPSGGTIGGDTSTTPSVGGSMVPAIGPVKDPSGGSSPVGPAPTTTTTTTTSGGLFSAITPNPTAPTDTTTILSFGSLSGVTTKQVSKALEQEGPSIGLVW